MFKKITKIIGVVMVFAILIGILGCFFAEKTIPGFVSNIVCEKMYGDTTIPHNLFVDYFDIYNYQIIKSGKLSKQSDCYTKYLKETERIKYFSEDKIKVIDNYYKAWNDLTDNPKINGLLKCYRLSILKKEIERYYGI